VSRSEGSVKIRSAYGSYHPRVFRNDEHGEVFVMTDGEKADVAITKGT
jgi:CTP synthase (UTP-ammonia lyase)